MTDLAAVVHFTYKFHGCQPRGEIDVFTSADFARGNRIVHKFESVEPGRGAVSGVVSFPLKGDAKEGQFLLDDAIHFRVYEYKTNPKGGEDLFLPSGIAYIYIAELLGRKKSVTVPVRIAALTAWDYDAANAPHGTLTASLEWPTEDIKPDFLPPEENVDLIPFNQNVIDAVLDREVAQTIALGNPEEHLRLNKNIQMTEEVMAKIRARYDATGFFSRVPGYVFFRPWDRFGGDDIRAIEHFMELAVRRGGWTVMEFKEQLREVCKPGSLTLMQALALDTVALGLTLLCLSMYYVSDFAPQNSNIGWSSGLHMVEYFEDALRRRQGDCEDFAKIVCVLIHIILNTDIPSTFALLPAVKELLIAYVNCACLLSVEGAQFGDGDSATLDLRKPDNAGSHMQATAFDRRDFTDMLARVNGDMKSFCDITNTGRFNKRLPPLQMEGTGNMFALQRVKAHMKEKKDRLDYDNYLEAQTIAAGRVMDFNSISEAAKRGDESVRLSVPAFMKPWKIRRMPTDTEQRTTPLNDFYRSYRCLMPFFDDEGDLGIYQTRSGEWCLNSIDVGTNMDLYGRRVPFQVGAPSFDVAGGAPTTMGTMVPPQSDLTKKILARWRRHLAPAVPITMPSGIPDSVKDLYSELLEATGANTQPLLMPKKPDETLLILTMNMRESHRVGAQEFGAHIRNNPFILSKSLYIDDVSEDLFVLVLALHVKIV